MATVAQGDTETHPEYKDNLDIWVGIRDACKGPKAVKSKKTVYLPDPSTNAARCNDKNGCNTRYERYLKAAIFYAYCKSTRQKITGQVYSKPTVIELPASLEGMINNIDGAGLTFEQQSKTAVGDNVSIGRGGLFVDFPVNDIEEKNAANTADLIPTITNFQAEEIIDWNTRTERNRTFLSYLKLRYVEYEQVEDEKTSAMSTECVTYIKELHLDDEGDYFQVTYKEDDKEEDKALARGNAVYPFNREGTYFKYIPFFPYGAENNNINVDESPFEELVHINYGHYVNSADHEENLFFSGQLTPVLGMDATYYDQMYEKKTKTITIGSGSVIMVPPDGKCEVLQMSPNSALREAMLDKVVTMVELGASITKQVEVQKSATESAINDRGQKSTVISTVANVSQAYDSAFRSASDFMPSANPDEVVIRINLNYNFSQITAADLEKLSKLVVESRITEKEFRDMMIDADYKIEKDYDIFLEQREGQTE